MNLRLGKKLTSALCQKNVFQRNLVEQVNIKHPALQFSVSRSITVHYVRNRACCLFFNHWFFTGLEKYAEE